MNTYHLKFSLPDIKDGPVITVTVEAPGPQTAMDAGFDKAFSEYPQFGGFQLDDIQEVS